MAPTSTQAPLICLGGQALNGATPLRKPHKALQWKVEAVIEMLHSQLSRLLNSQYISSWGLYDLFAGVQIPVLPTDPKNITAWSSFPPLQSHDWESRHCRSKQGGSTQSILLFDKERLFSSLSGFESTELVPKKVLSFCLLKFLNVVHAVQRWDWLTSVDLHGTYNHVPTAPEDRCFLRLAFQGQK